MRIPEVMKSMRVKPKEEMMENGFSVRREPSLLMQSSVPLQNLHQMHQLQRPLRRLVMTSMEETLRTITRWIRMVKPTATSPWTSRWA